jgi:hypothetical protein
MNETAKTPLRMTATEFVTCLHVMTQAGKARAKDSEEAAWHWLPQGRHR